MSTTKLTPDEQKLLCRWQDRLATYRSGDMAAMPVGIVGLGDLRVMGRAGDARLTFPRVKCLSDLDALPDDVRFGLELANRTITAYRAQGAGRMVYASAPPSGQYSPEPEMITMIDPTKHSDILIVAPIAGG